MARLKAPQRREQLLEVATRLFASRGYEGTTTAAIAQAAGVKEPILYRHFSGKQDLFITIVRRVSLLTLQRWQKMIVDVDGPAEQIRVIAREYPTLIRDLSDACHVIHGAMATSTDRKVIQVLADHYAQIQEFLVGIIRDGQSRGAFNPKMDPHVPAWGLIYMGLGFAMTHLNLPSLDGTRVEPLIESILSGLEV